MEQYLVAADEALEVDSADDAEDLGDAKKAIEPVCIP